MPETEAELEYELLNFIQWLNDRAGITIWADHLSQIVGIVETVQAYIAERQPIDPDVVGLLVQKGDKSNVL